MLHSGTFTELDPAERTLLAEWLAGAAGFRVDTVIDLKGRDWNTIIPRSVIGVFLKDTETAAWLVVGRRGQWVLADCASGAISTEMTSLADILALIPLGCP